MITFLNQDDIKEALERVVLRDATTTDEDIAGIIKNETEEEAAISAMTG